jgi:hypothetical protein
MSNAARKFISDEILLTENLMTDLDYAISQGAYPIRDLEDKYSNTLRTLHALLAGLDSGALSASYEDNSGEPQFSVGNEDEKVHLQWAQLNEMLDETFVSDNEAWFDYVVNG